MLAMQALLPVDVTSTLYIVADVTPTAPLAGGVLEAEDAAPVPEPASMLLLGTGLFGLAGMVRKRVRK